VIQQPLHRNVLWYRGGLVFEAHRLTGGVGGDEHLADEQLRDLLLAILAQIHLRRFRGGPVLKAHRLLYDLLLAILAQIHLGAQIRQSRPCSGLGLSHFPNTKTFAILAQIHLGRWGLELRVRGLGFRDLPGSLGFVVCGLWFVVCGLWFGVCGLWFVVWS